MSEQATEIPGVELGDRLIRREVRQDPRMAVFIANVEVDGIKQPTLIVGRRTGGQGRSYMIPLNVAWQYNEPEMLPEKLEKAALVLFGPGFSRGEATTVMDVILHFLPELFSFAPDAEKQRLDAGLQRILTQHQVTIEDSAGRLILDASGA